MTPRLSRADYERRKGDKNRRALKRLVDGGREPGLLGYQRDEPVAWIALAPREEYVQLRNSRILAPVDERPVWSITCLFVRKDLRNRGVSVRAIRAAVDHARARGATALEAYPVDPRTNPVPAVFAYPGLLGAYLAAGFREVERRSPTRPIVRRLLRPRRG